MGILRTDRISGLGGANAITGSTFFGNSSSNSNGNYLRVGIDSTEDFAFGTGDFTIEFWFNRVLSTHQQHFYDFRGTSNTNRLLVYMVNNVMYYFGSGSERITSGTVPSGEWVHFALVRSSASTKMYFNGTQTGSTYSDSINFVGPDKGSGFIGSNSGTDGINPSGSYLSAHLSNFRVQKGKAEYTAAFTPPTHRLEKTAETVLLTCNSPGDVTNEETGKVVTPERVTLNDALPQASRFTPNSPVGFSTTTDVGTQFGSTFDGVTTFDSQAYFVPPGGNTRERNRGRGLVGGGDSQNTSVGFIDIQSQGNANEFGQLTFGRLGMSACASSTRILFCGGYDAPSNTNIIDFFTIASTSNATDFGDLSVTDHEHCALSNQTRGLIIGGTGPSVTIDFVTIAQTGNASDFGDLIATKRGSSGGASPTRGLFCGSATPQASAQIDFVTIATTGNSADFGDLTVSRGRLGSVSSSVRTVIAGGYTPSSPNLSNTIDFVTIATTGNATDFGDLSFTASQMNNGMSNNSRGVFVVTGSPSAVNNLEFITIASTGNASDFGDAHQAQNRATSGSDSHGGLS